MAKETINFSLTVNSVNKAFQLVDMNGNVLANGDSVSLAAQTVGVADPGQALFTVSGGKTPYSFSIASGTTPDGDFLNSTENEDGSETVTIEGTPTTAGTSEFAILVSDAAGASATITAKKPIQ